MEKNKQKNSTLSIETTQNEMKRKKRKKTDL